MHPGPPDSQTVLNALKGPCLEGVAKLKLPPSQDVPEVNRSVRESLTRNMRRLKTGRSDGPALIQPLVGQAGSGKTHILSWLRGETLREGGFFIAADLTASNKDLFLSLNRAAEDSLTYDTGEERSQLGRLLDNLVAEAGVAKSLGGLGSRLPLPQPEAASALAAVSAGLLRKHMSEALRYKTVIESVFLLASAEQDDIYSAHAFFCTPKPTSLEAFGGLTWLMSLGSFTVLAMDQLDAIVSNLRTDEANKTRRDLVHDLSIDMGSIHDHAFRTLPVLTLLEEAWQYLTNVALLSSLGRFEHESTLSPVNDAALLERIVALRLKEAYDEIGFTPEYPSWPFPRAFFEANEGKFPRELLKACRKHVKDCTVFRRAVPWPIIEDAGEPQVPPPAKGDVEAGRREELLAEMDAMFADVLKDFPPVAEKAFWDRTVLTYLECLALEDPAAEAAGVTVDSRSGVLPIGRYATVTTAPPGPELILTVVTALGNHGTRYCTILDDALRRSGVQKDLPERRLAVVRPGGTRLPGPRTQSHEAYAKLLQAGGRLAFPTPEDETELFALSEVRNRYPNSFQEWAVSRRPAGRIKLLKEELDWLLKSSVTVHGPASVTTPRAGNAPPATPQAGSPPPGEPKPGNAPPAAPQAESPPPSVPKPGNAPPAAPQAGSQPSPEELAGTVPTATPQAGSPPPSGPKPGNAPLATPQAESQASPEELAGTVPTATPQAGRQPPSGPKPGNAPPATPQAGSQPSPEELAGTVPTATPQAGSQPPATPQAGSQPSTDAQAGTVPPVTPEPVSPAPPPQQNGTTVKAKPPRPVTTSPDTSATSGTAVPPPAAVPPVPAGPPPSATPPAPAGPPPAAVPPAPAVTRPPATPPAPAGPPPVAVPPAPAGPPPAAVTRPSATPPAPAGPPPAAVPPAPAVTRPPATPPAPAGPPPSAKPPAPAGASPSVTPPAPAGAPTGPAHPGAVRAGTLASGWRDTTGGPALMSIDDFREHVAILGQSGSGKTVLLRRLIEEAAIQGVSSLVIDCSGDLTFLARPWPERPESFTPEDDAKAARFFRDVDVVVWTPFQGSGNPYIPPRVPDLREIAGRGDADELDAALEMAVRTVPGNFGLTRKLADSERLALTYALRRIANGGVEPGLESLVRTLEAIVDDADSGDYTASFNKGAEKLLESFKNTMLAKPNLKRNGTGDIRVLLDPNAARPRVSVLNLTLGGPSPELLRETVQNVLTSIYAMATANHPRSMNGIIAIDEAKEFVPSRITVESKSIIIKLASMARKYGYGLVLASQSVTSLDTQAINNFSTKFVGKHSSGAAVTAAVRFLETDEQLRLSHLENGCFYVRGKSLHGQGAKAAKVRTSLCLSRHPDTAPPPEEILEIARKSAPAAEVRG